MRITDFPDKFARTKTETDVPFDTFCGEIINAPPVPYKEDCRWIKMGVFGDVVDNPQSGCLRTNANLLAITGVEVDYDLEEMTIDEAADLLRERGIKAFLYSSPSNRTDAQRWRALCPTSREYDPVERDAFAARINGVLGGVVSDESHTRSQGYYAGRVAGVPFEWRMVDGAFIDQVDGLPEIGRSGGTATGPSGYTREAAYDDIRDGIELHRAINFLAMLGDTREAIEVAMHESRAKTDDARRWAKRLAEIDRSIRGAARRRERDMQKRAAAVGVPPRYSTDKAGPGGSGFQTFTAASLAGKPIPEQEWLADGMIPAGQPVLFSGDGGLGKSLLALQLAIAVAKGGQWLGMYVPQGPALYLSAEDETAELHRRITRITADIEKLDGLHIAPMAELDPLLVTPGPRGGGLNTTALYDAVAARVTELRPVLVVLDSAADYFGGNEVVRSEVRWFISQLRKLCHSTGCTVLMLSHPSVSGMQSGSGLSGSTHWNNSVRSRLYLTKPGGEDGDRDERVLEVMKNNRGPLGKRLALRWSNGAFVESSGPAEGVTEADVDALFMDLLAQYTEQGRYVNAAGGLTFAPSAFSKDETARRLRVNKKALTDAMNRLLKSKRVAVLTRKVSGHDRTYLSVVPPE